MTENSPYFHLPLDEIRTGPKAGDQIAKNVGKLGSDAILHGNPQIAYDPELGACMAFDGQDDYVELVQLQGYTFDAGLAISVWVRFDDLNNWSRIFCLNEAAYASTDPVDQHYVFLGIIETTGDLELNTDEKKGIRINNVIVKDTWHHIAATYDTTGNIRLFIDGKQVASNVAPNDSVFAGTPWRAGLIGKSTWKRGESLFKGRMANFRLYNQALAQAQIQDIMETDLLRSARIRETTLLKADLYTVHESDHKPLIFIEAENRSEPLEVAVANPGGKPVKFINFDSETQPDEDNFHLQLRFRRNVIAERIRTRLQNQEIKIPGWKHTHGVAADQREEFIAFIKEGGTFSVPNDGRSQLLTIPEFSAAARGGARNTRVEIRFRTEAQDPGSIIRHLEIHSHLGLKTVPLLARIAGSNTVLSNEADNELTIEIRNLGDKPVQLVKGTSFDLIVDQELMSNNRLNATMPGLNDVTGQEGQEHKTKAFVAAGDLEVKQGSPLVLKIDDWATPNIFGIYNLLVRYENIPGYWDGGWTLPVQVSPLVMKQGRVGIGTDEPQTTLLFKGMTTLEGNLNVGGSGNGAISVSHINGKSYHSAEPDGLYLNHDTGKNVEVGSQSANADLIVHGRVKDQGGELMPVGAIIAYGGETPPSGWYICDGSWINYDDEYWKNLNKELYVVLGSPRLIQRHVVASNREHVPDGNAVKWSFQLPDLRSRFIVGVGQGEGLSKYQVTNTGGYETITLNKDQIPAHFHQGTTNTDGNHKHNNLSSTKMEDDYNSKDTAIWLLNGWGGGGDPKKYIPLDGSEHNHGFTTNIDGGGNAAHENRPPYYALTYIIKY